MAQELDDIIATIAALGEMIRGADPATCVLIEESLAEAHRVRANLAASGAEHGAVVTALIEAFTTLQAREDPRQLGWLMAALYHRLEVQDVPRAGAMKRLVERQMETVRDRAARAVAVRMR